MDATEKAKWVEEAAKDKERFNKENAAYLAKKQPESLKADDANLGEVGETSIKSEEVSGSDMDASHMFETIEAALVKSEVVEEEVKMEVSEKTIVKAKPKVNMGNGVKGKTSRKVKVPTSKETSGNSGNVAATSGVVCSSSGEIPAPVANYFAFLFSRWAGMRQVCPQYILLRDDLIFVGCRSIQTARRRTFKTCCGSSGVLPAELCHPP